MKKYLITLLLVALAVSACSAQATEPGKNTQEASATDSLIGAWQLTSFGPVDAPTPAVDGVNAGLTFSSDGKVSGTSGCNGLGGDYSVEGDKITFGEFVSTLMACDEPVMVQEDAAHKVMTGTATYKIEGDTLTITNDDMVLILTRDTLSTAEPVTPTTLIGTWNLDSYGTTSTVSSALADVTANLTFSEDGMVTGTSGCNEFGGKFVVEAEQITFQEVVSTLKLCDSTIMGQEEAMQQVLTETASYTIEGNTLTLTNNDRVLVLTR